MNTKLNWLYQEALQEFPNSKKTKTVGDVISTISQSKTEAKKRLREYLDDTISEFVDANVLSADEFYQVLMDSVHDNWQFYQRNANENKKLLDRLQ